LQPAGAPLAAGEFEVELVPAVPARADDVRRLEVSAARVAPGDGAEDLVPTRHPPQRDRPPDIAEQRSAAQHGRVDDGIEAGEELEAARGRDRRANVLSGHGLVHAHLPATAL